MADGRVSLDELNTNSHNYKVKVKVVQKGKPLKSATDVLYQTVVLQDDKGNRMRGTLFGDQIGGHEDALVYNGVYEIANAPIRPLLEQYRRDPSEIAYTMGFGHQTLIRPLTTTPEAFLPDYQCISKVPKTATTYDIFDVIGTLLYVEPAAREVGAKQGRKNTVREVILTDHSAEQPIVVSAWNELAGSDCDKLASLVETLPVVGFTALRVSTHKGFSLTGTMSTLINANPTGAKVDAMLDWGGRNKEVLKDLQARINRLRDPNAPIGVLSLSALKTKKAKQTLQDERYYLDVTVPAPEFQKINAYLGCSHCGKRTDYAAGESFKCETCTKDGVVAEPRITFNCEISDGTDQLEITTFTEDTAKLFQMPASDIFHMKHSGDKTAFENVRASLKNVPFKIEMSPKTALSRNNILQWALRQIVTKPDRAAPFTTLPQADNSGHNIVGDVTKQATQVARHLDFGDVAKQPSNLTLVEVAVSSDYPPRRKLPISITAPTTPEAIPALTSKAMELDQTAISATTHADATPARQASNPISPAVTTAPTTSLLQTPKAGKQVANTPETPAQGTPKRATAKQIGSPSKKKKADTSLSAGQ